MTNTREENAAEMQRDEQAQSAESFEGHAGWTLGDDAKAAAEGWNVWACYGSDNGLFQICRNDDDEAFTSDRDAWEHVAIGARSGEALPLKALRFIRRHNPLEFGCLCQDFPWLVEIV